jgi:hypothetical protein
MIFEAAAPGIPILRTAILHTPATKCMKRFSVVRDAYTVERISLAKPKQITPADHTLGLFAERALERLHSAHLETGVEA